MSERTFTIVTWALSILALVVALTVRYTLQHQRAELFKMQSSHSEGFKELIPGPIPEKSKR